MPVNKKNTIPKKATNIQKHHIPNFLEGAFEFQKLEERVLTFWDEHKIFEKSLEENQAKNKGKKSQKFVFYEGPPTANGKPGIHHVLARVVKDIILRYKTMRGYYVPRRAGWDTHGLPVEIDAEKALGLKSKKDIEQYGIEAFNKKAKELAWIHKDEMEKITHRIGYWLDFKDAYITYEPEYIESVWWTLSQIAKRKLLYKGNRIVQWCTRCGTGLSSHELAQGYKEVEDNSVYVKFKLKKGQIIGNWKTGDRSYILSWTTTPWTLPGNVALAVGNKIKYIATEKDGDELWYAKDSLIAKELGIAGREISGSDLIGLEYEPLFNIPSLVNEKSYKIYSADFVTTTDGTGVVHTAVMYGEDDYALGKKIGLPEKHTVNEEGKFTDEVPGFEGMYVKAKETEEKIFEYLKAQKNLFSIEKYTHEYPHCWRCSTPILYYARTSWFIAMSGLRKELLAQNQNINWMPEHVKNGRFGEWLREAKDWNLSRERYWGTPLPIWECKECGHTTVVGGIDELDKIAGGSKNNYWVMRHGEAENNIFNIINSKGGAFHLTPRGRKQVTAAVKKLKAELSKEHKSIDMIIASDILRTKETGSIAREILLSGKELLTDQRLEEIHLGPKLDGYHDGRYREQFPTYESRFERRPEDGESLRDVRGRVWGFLEECEKKYEGKNILIISHEYPIWMLRQSAEGWSEKRAILEKEIRDKEKSGVGFVGFAELRKLNLLIVPRNESGEVDLHRPYADMIIVPCQKCKAEMRRVLEVADVWYDSGAMPFAQVHWPFSETQAKGAKTENQTKLDFPADYISEGMDQTRGWFYTMLAIATAMGYQAPYKNVISLGLINDKFGQKMSKSKGNIVDPWTMISTYGIDAVRWYFFTAAPLGEPRNFDEQEIAKSFRKTHLIVYNSFIFLKTYADMSYGGDKLKNQAIKSKNLLDQWIIVRLNETVGTVGKMLDQYEIRDAALAIDVLIDDLSRWYIRRSRKRLQSARGDTSDKSAHIPDYQNASATLKFVLLELTKLMAPFTPFFSEMLYSGLNGGKESVHLDGYPNGTGKHLTADDKKLLMQMKIVREFAAAGLAKRAEVGIKVRQPLAALKIKDKKIKLEKEFCAVLADEVNVKEIVFDAKIDGDIELDTVITPALREEGLVREFSRAVQELRQTSSLRPKDVIAVSFDTAETVRNAIIKNESVVKAEIGAKIITVGRSDKCTAEATIKMENTETWIGIRKIDTIHIVSSSRRRGTTV